MHETFSYDRLLSCASLELFVPSPLSEQRRQTQRDMHGHPQQRSIAKLTLNTGISIKLPYPKSTYPDHRY